MGQMASDIPTGKTYLGFVFLWGVLVTPAAAAFALTMLLHGQKVAGVFVIVVTIYLFVRHARSIGRRARQSIRRRAAIPPQSTR
jgi:1,4-dihydroxy-2-naphthoate octaprenyltransferase